MRNILLIAIVSLLSAFFGVLIYVNGFQPEPSSVVIYESPANHIPMQFTAHGEDNKVQPIDFTKAAGMSTISVVHISTTQRNKTDYGQVNEQSPIYEYFDSFSDAAKVSSGSGVIISSDGYIVTNNHVVKDGKRLRVTLYNKKTYDAQLMGADPTTDIALLKIDEKDLPFIKFSDSDDARVGEWVLAVGNPFNLASTVTAGIISAKGRDIDILDEKNAIESFLQTDAAVNEGNSGGPLVNIRGELVGINTAIATSGGNFSGYSFAVPSNIVFKAVQDLKKFQKVQRANLGVTISNIDDLLSKTYNLKSLRGVFVEAISRGGAAQRAGLKHKDVIVSIDNEALSNVSKFGELMAKYSPGETVSIGFIREGRDMQTQVLLRNEFNEMNIVKDNQIEIERKLGARFEDLTLSELRDLNLLSGVRVFELSDGVFKYFTRMEEGFIIQSIDRKPVKNAEEIYKIFSRINPGDNVNLEGSYPRDPLTRNYTLTMPE